MLMTCNEPGCKTIVMGGGRCVAHETYEARVFLRGRPFTASAAAPFAQSASNEGVVALAATDFRQLSDLPTAHTAFERPR